VVVAGLLQYFLFFFVLLFLIFFYFFIFWKLICRGGYGMTAPLEITRKIVFLAARSRNGTAPAPKNIFLPVPINFFYSALHKKEHKIWREKAIGKILGKCWI
jgi:hypothetical protein